MAPLSNAERQARWREKRNALAKQAEKLAAQPTDPDRIEQFLDYVESVACDVTDEGEKNMATMSPATVATLAGRLMNAVDAMRDGTDLPKFIGDAGRRYAEKRTKYRKKRDSYRRKLARERGEVT